MSKNKIFSLICLAILVLVAIFFVMGEGNVTLISPVIKQDKQAVASPTALPNPAKANAPQTFQYGAQTDLKKELDTINPEVNDSDFAGIN